MRNRVILLLIVLAVAAGLGFMLFGGSGTQNAPQSSRPAHDKKTAVIPVEFELIRLSREGVGVIAGRATPGGFVDVMAEGRSIGKSRASDTGSWEIVVGTALQPGTHVLGLAAMDDAGQETRSTDVAVVAVPPPPDKGPDLKTAKGEKKPVLDDGVLAIILPRQPGTAGRVLQRPGQLTPKLALGIDLADFDAAGSTVLGGRAIAGNDVNVYLDGRPVGTARTDDEGTWSITLPAVSAAAHNIRLEEIDPGDAVVQNVDQPFNPAITLAVDAGSGSAVVQPDQTVWHVVRRQVGGAMRYTQVFRADQGVAEATPDGGAKAPGVLKPGSDL